MWEAEEKIMFNNLFWKKYHLANFVFFSLEICPYDISCVFSAAYDFLPDAALVTHVQNTCVQELLSGLYFGSWKKKNLEVELRNKKSTCARRFCTNMGAKSEVRHVFGGLAHEKRCTVLRLAQIRCTVSASEAKIPCAHRFFVHFCAKPTSTGRF